jgi:hypothetical protein
MVEKRIPYWESNHDSHTFQAAAVSAMFLVSLTTMTVAQRGMRGLVSNNWKERGI